MTLLRFGIPRTCARFRHLTLAVSAQVIMQVGFGDLARAEDRPSSPEVGVSACRPTAGLAAFGNGREPRLQCGKVSNSRGSLLSMPKQETMSTHSRSSTVPSA